MCEAGNVHEGYDGDVEGVAETYETCGFSRRVDVEHTGQVLGLVGHDAYRCAAHVSEADDDVLGVVLVDLEEFSVIHDAADDIVHVVSLVGAIGYDGVEGVLKSLDRVCGGLVRRLLHVVLRNEGEELADDGDSVFL